MTINLQGTSVLITGASGFLGRQLSAALIRLGAEVLGIDQNPSPFNESGSENKPEAYRHIQAEFNTATVEAERFFKNSPTSKRTVFHLAGLADAGYCRDHPDLAFEANIKLTFDVLEFCRRIGDLTLVFPSTGLVYGDALDCPASEDDPVFSTSVYAAMKLAAETLICSYAANFSCSSIIARLSNVYGPGMSEKTVVGKILAQAERGEPIQVMDEAPVRDFIFSHDVVEALIRLSLLKLNNSALTVNVSTGTGVSIASIVAEAAKLFSAPKVDSQHPKNISESPSRLVLSNEKIKRLTGWAPPTRLVEGLQKSMNYMDYSIKND